MANLKKLREIRDSKGWTQEELAEKADIVPGTYQAYESARISIPADARKKIEKALSTKDIEWPARGGKITLADLESLRAEIRTQVAWAREEIRKDIQGAVADILESLERIEPPKGAEHKESRA